MLDHDDARHAELGDEMARAAKPLDAAKIARHVQSLEEAALDRKAFDAAFGLVKSDASLSAAEVVEIARQFRGGGSKAKSKKAALEAIERRFIEKMRSAGNKREAANARPW